MTPGSCGASGRCAPNPVPPRARAMKLSGAQDRGSAHDETARHCLYADRGRAVDRVEHPLGRAATKHLEVHVDAG